MKPGLPGNMAEIVSDPVGRMALFTVKLAVLPVSGAVPSIDVPNANAIVPDGVEFALAGFMVAVRSVVED